MNNDNEINNNNNQEEEGKHLPPYTFPKVQGLFPPVYHPFLDPDYQYKTAPTTTGIIPVVIRAYEHYKQYPYNDNYMISNMGEVYSKGRKKRLVTRLDQDGYEKVYVGKTRTLHGALMDTFHPNPDPEKYDQINHWDGRKTNNFYLGPNNTNLFWSNAKDNVNHALENGLRYQTGEANQFAQIDNYTAEEICKRIAAGMTGRQIADDLGMEYNAHFQDRISKIRRGLTWKFLADKYGIKPKYRWNKDK